MESKVSVIGQRIYDLRVEKNIQQGELAKAVHIHQSVLNRIERGTRPARDTEIRDIAIYFGVSADTLLAIPAASVQEILLLGRFHPPNLPLSKNTGFSMPAENAPSMIRQTANTDMCFRYRPTRPVFFICFCP